MCHKSSFVFCIELGQLVKIYKTKVSSYTMIICMIFVLSWLCMFF